MVEQEKPLSEIIAALDALKKQATPGEWFSHRTHYATNEEEPDIVDVFIISSKNPHVDIAQLFSRPFQSLWNDSAFITALKNSWPRISAELKRLQEGQTKELREALEFYAVGNRVNGGDYKVLIAADDGTVARQALGIEKNE